MPLIVNSPLAMASNPVIGFIQLDIPMFNFSPFLFGSGSGGLGYQNQALRRKDVGLIFRFLDGDCSATITKVQKT
jgi:hypothetical protein